MRCINTGRKCDGYKPKTTQSSRTPSPNPTDTLPVLPKFDDPTQRELFGFFVSCTSNPSSIYFGTDFWCRRVLQLSLNEDSIRYALYSLSAMHRMSTGYTYSRNFEDKQYALQQYNYAVNCTQKLLAESSDGSEDKVLKGLVACVLFVCYENFAGNYKTAQMHLQNGLQIILADRRKWGGSRIPTDISLAFERLDLQSMTVADSAAPYPYHLRNDPIELPKMSTTLATIEDSMAFILHIFMWICRKAASWEPDPIPNDDLDSARQAVKQWEVQSERILAELSTKMTDALRPRVMLLKIYQVITTIIISTGVYGQEILHDKHRLEYQQVISWAEKVLESIHTTPPSNQILSFDIGVIMPLFFTAIKCRDPQLRRRAIGLLASKRIQEGSLNSLGAAKVAEFVMNIEEEGLPPDFSQYHVVETARVHLVKTVIDAERGEIGLSCLLRSDIDTESWYMREGQVSYAEEFHQTSSR